MLTSAASAVAAAPPKPVATMAIKGAAHLQSEVVMPVDMVVSVRTARRKKKPDQLDTEEEENKEILGLTAGRGGTTATRTPVRKHMGVDADAEDDDEEAKQKAVAKPVAKATVTIAPKPMSRDKTVGLRTSRAPRTLPSGSPALTPASAASLDEQFYSLNGADDDYDPNPDRAHDPPSPTRGPECMTRSPQDPEFASGTSRSTSASLPLMAAAPAPPKIPGRLGSSTNHVHKLCHSFEIPKKYIPHMFIIIF